MSLSKEKNVAIIGAGLFGLVTAKVFVHDFSNSFDSVTVYEKNSGLGGVWSEDRIYPGLTSNSPALTYEIPGFQFPEHIRRYGSHVKAEDINTYLHAFADQYDLKEHIQFNSLVENVRWNKESKRWMIQGRFKRQGFAKSFKYLVICNGMYEEANLPPVARSWSSFGPKVYHSADVGDPSIRTALSTSRHTLVIGAGKSAIDLATMIAGAAWNPKNSKTPEVTLLYKRPHWLSPRGMLRGTIYFERLLFSRFLNAWLPFAKSPDFLHQWIAESNPGRWITEMVFKFVSDDFKKSCNQSKLPETIPDYPMKQALSGALHVVPNGYIDLVKKKKINVRKGVVYSMSNDGVMIEAVAGESYNLPVDYILCATGYKIVFPFLDLRTMQVLGLISETSTNCDALPYLKLYRLLVPPKTVHPEFVAAPYRNIAFNGFAYSFLNPTVSFVSAHWIAEYFLGLVSVPSLGQVQQDVEQFYRWQKGTFAADGAKGVHIGPHATLYTDILLEDMDLRTGHVAGTMLNPVNLVKEWCRPMYPQIYAGMAEDRRERDLNARAKSMPTKNEPKTVAQFAQSISSRIRLGLFVLMFSVALAKLILYLEHH